MIDDNDQVLSAIDTARKLGVSKITLLRMRKLPDAGGLPYVRLSANRVGYIRRDLRAYLAARRVGKLEGEP